jgi:replicative DNA helicase
VPVLIFSLEMKRQELLERALSGQSGIDGRHIVSAQLGVRDWDALHAAGAALREAFVWIDDRKLTTSRICSEAMRWREKTRRRKAKTGDKPDDRALVVVDYLGLVRTDRRGENRNLEVAAMTAAFKALAGDLDCPVMVLSQLNRSSAKDKRKPVQSDLRDSGAIEADADMVIFPWHPEADEGDKRMPPEIIDATIIVAKHRNGPMGEVDVKFRPSTTQFLDRDHDRWKAAPNGEFPAHYTDSI